MRLPKHNNAKLLVAVIAASGLVTVGALTVAIGQQRAASATLVSSGSSTASGPSSTTSTGVMAVPLITLGNTLPTEEQGPAAP
jgi:hypothetical protein